MCICVIGDFALKLFSRASTLFFRKSYGTPTSSVSIGDRVHTLDGVPQKKEAAAGVLLENLRKQDFVGPYIVVPRESQDRSVVIVLLTSCPHETCFACFSSWVTRWFFRIL